MSLTGAAASGVLTAHACVYERVWVSEGYDVVVVVDVGVRANSCAQRKVCVHTWKGRADFSEQKCNRYRHQTIATQYCEESLSSRAVIGSVAFTASMYT